MTAGSGLDGKASLVLLGTCVAALALCVWGLLVQRTYAVLPAEKDYRELVPVTVDGIEARTEEELDHLLRHRETGPVTVVKAGKPGTVTLVGELRGAPFVFTLLEVLAFWVVCTFVLAPRAGRRGIRDLLASLLLGAVAIAIGGTTTPRGPGETVLSVAFLLSMTFMGPFGVRFSTAFPRPLLGPRRAARLVGTLFAAAVLLGAWNIVAWLHAVGSPGVLGVSSMGLPAGCLAVLTMACLLIACWNLVRSGRRAPLAREQRQARWILWGLAIGASPYLVLRNLPRIVGWDAPWPASVDRVVEMTIPLTIAIAVVKERFLDIDVIIRRSVLYTLLALLGAFVFFGGTLLLLLGRPDRLSTALGSRVLWAGAIAGAITGLLYRPARRRIGRWIDRTFFRVRHSHDQALGLLEGSLAAAAGQEAVAAQLCAFLERLLAPKGAAVVLDSDGDERICVRGTLREEDVRRKIALPEEAEREGGVLARVDATGVPEIETTAFPEDLARAGVRVVQPIVTDGRRLGLLLLGEKVTERHYLEEELALLRSIASRAAAALERMTLVQKVAEEAMARRTLAEVARQKADFFARLAHDLRTPITAVRWPVQNLLDELAGPLTDRQRQYLEGVGAASGQLARLVDNLVDLGRLELDAPRRPMEPVDLAAVVHEVATALAALADERRARLEVEVSEGVPPVRGRRDAAFQIVLNLVDNALKYTAPDTAVEVTVRQDDESGEVVLGVRDHGPGLPEDSEPLFALFEQGPESPHGPAKGYGIGLHIVRSWVEALSGRIAADNHPEGGARFTCRLLPWKEEEATG